MSEHNGSNKPQQNPDDLDRMERLVDNVMSLRRELIDRLLGNSTRDLNKECDYPDTFTPQEYQHLYDRDPIAHRVVEVLPRECWQVTPEVYDYEQEESPFSEAWGNLGRQLRGEGSWYQDEVGSNVWETLCRADILSGIGSFGLVLLAFDDGLPMDQPAYGGKNAKASGPGERRLLFMRAFPESAIQVTRFNDDPKSPRFCRPESYLVTFNDPTIGAQSAFGVSTSLQNVHWTRVIHVADNLGSSEDFGYPRCQPVLNAVLDLRKIRGASAEGYWKSCFASLSLETHPQLGGDVKVNQEGLRQMMADYANGLSRYLALQGMSAKTLSPSVIDPSPFLNTLVEHIAIEIGIPIRVFKGSERGELASSQDDSAWNDRIRHRQMTYLTPRIVVPLIDRLIRYEILPKPQGKSAAAVTNARARGAFVRRIRGGHLVYNKFGKPTKMLADGGYSVDWPDLDSLGDQAKAGIAQQEMGTISSYLNGGVESLLTPKMMLTQFLHRTEAEADAIIADAKKAQAEPPPSVSESRARQAAPGQVQGIMSILDQYKTDAISKTTAKQMLVLVFRFPEEDAEQMLTGVNKDEPPFVPAQQAAQLAGAETGAIVQYIQGGVEKMVTPLDFLTKFLGKDKAEAQAMLDAAKAATEAKEGVTPAGGGEAIPAAIMPPAPPAAPNPLADLLGGGGAAAPGPGQAPAEVPAEGAPVEAPAEGQIPLEATAAVGGPPTDQLMGLSTGRSLEYQVDSMSQVLETLEAAIITVNSALPLSDEGLRDLEGQLQSVVSNLDDLLRSNH